MADNLDASYSRKVLHGNETFEIVSCEWNKSSVSALHNHGWSQCLVLVQEGCFENRSEFGLKTELSLIEPGQIIFTPQGVRHEIKCMSDVGRTLHVYVPKIKAHSDQGRFSSLSLAQIQDQMNLALFDGPTAWLQVEKALNSIGENSISTHSPYFMNQLFSGVFPETLAAGKIVSQSRTTLATFEASPVFTAIELEVVNKLCELIGWPEGQRDGIGVAGGSAANLMALHCARQRRVPEYHRRGLSGEKFKIFASQEAHYSLKKACLVTGLGTGALVLVKTDADGCMNTADLRLQIQTTLAKNEIPLMVCATAGTTVLGAFDPIEIMADVCKEFGIWLHVDGAWGAPALFSKSARTLMKGIEQADSLTFDAHKLFGADLTCSFFLTKNQGVLLEANDVAGGDYIFHSEEVVQDRGRLSWQCGRGAEALAFWTLWKNNGTQGLGDFVDRLFALREECVHWIKLQPRLQLISKPEYLNVCVRVNPPEGVAIDPDWSTTVRNRLKADDFAFVNFSKNSEGSFLRLILANPHLEFSHLKNILQRALEIR